tara:strand:- start:7354 stop:8271 length:918 start_codon:yes stop_codon:yes gene_type:complete
LNQRISVIIPTYNYANAIEAAVESVLQQSAAAAEIIIIDDGSTDNTVDVIADLQQRYPDKIHYLQQPNQGPGVARNRGAKEAPGDWLLFLDADDTLLPEALSDYQEYLINNPNINMVYTAHNAVSAEGKTRTKRGKPIATNNEINFCDYLLNKTIPLCNGAFIVKKKVFDALGYAEHMKSAEDICFFAHLLALHPCAYLDKVTVNIHKHSDSLRHNSRIYRKTALEVCDSVFTDTLPQALYKYRNEYAAKRYLSLFRNLYLAGEYQEARAVYHQALRQKPALLFKLSYLRKYLLSYLRKSHEATS